MMHRSDLSNLLAVSVTPGYLPALTRATSRLLINFDGNDGGNSAANNGGQGGGNNAGAGNAGNAGGANQAITFASQDALDELIERRTGRARKEADKEIADLKAKIEALGKGQGQQGQGQQQQQGQQGQGQGDTGERRYTQAEVEALISKDWTPKLDEANKTIAGLRDVMRDNAILRAAGAAHSPEEIVKLLRDEIGLDESGAAVALDAKGNPRLGADGKPITAEAHVAAYLGERKHLVKGSGIPGVGSHTGNGKPAGQQQDGKGLSFDSATTQLAAAIRQM